ncbi:acyl-CoA dehydrogenase family protein [Saccharothrix australiensis]|uniref:Alkylation response protein AidB-like acyl-CoA dehydrogenase n=1 Tax=Saccharothrix australiensis TaxID=2072 RepID=A0A495VYT9_9PSEU|nr:acyl-CoA dehydrogenase family protein [Saccharothrix australiensis]RKT54419.1 alkylation response protein AidB-like acyl-CoA dehydrogenase [Saccharothrix australiensis]
MVPSEQLTAAGSVIESVVAPQAAQVDREGALPRESIDALAGAGLLGLLSSADVGGAGGGLVDAARVVEALAGACGSTAMIALMHYSATALIEAHGDEKTRRAVAAGEHLSTLAFSEVGSRSHFWAPLSTATDVGGSRVRLDADKSWVTAAGHVDSYVWSSTPLSADGPMTVWLVPGDAAGISVRGGFDGLGLRGNASSPVTASAVEIPAAAILGDDGAGLDIALRTALPHFLVLNAAFSLGLIRSLVGEAGEHLKRTRLHHLDQALADQRHHRAAYARLLTRADEVGAFLDDTLRALETGRADATLRVLQVKSVAAEAAAEVADGVLKLCGGAAFRKELGVERRFRDALAARVMAPTTEALHDFVGRAALGLPLF